MPIVFTLPSNPSREIHLREATVADAIDFTGIDPDFEEEATTLFLNKLQERNAFSDSREWTGEDRRFALFQYYLNTSQYDSIPLTFTYNGERQTQLIPLTKILDTYKILDGKPVRDFAFNGHNVLVAPLRGYELEHLEKQYAEVRAWQAVLDDPKRQMDEKERRKIQKTVRLKRAAVLMSRVTAYLDIPGLDPNSTREGRRQRVREFVEALPMRDLNDLVQRTGECLKEMEHGLLSQYEDGKISLIIPDVVPEGAGEDDKLTLSYPFRFIDVIPTLW